MKEIYINCECGCEVLRVEYDEEYGNYYLGFYQSRKSYSLKDKLRYIWRIIKTGEPYGDQMVISKTQMKKLNKFVGETKYVKL